jgi:acylglycerol lipase
MPYFPGCRGQIFYDSWLPDGEVRSTVVLLHGYGEHLGLYDALARRLTADGHAVYALDEVGHGRSDGERALIESWDHLVDDGRTLAVLAREQHPGVPVVLVGHSGGGLAVTLLALRSPEIARALVVSGAPVLPLEWMEEVARSDVAETEAGDPTEFLSTHPDYVDALLNDPLTWKGGFKRETVTAVVATWPEVTAGLDAGRPDAPVLLVHGGADPVVPLEVAQEVQRRLPQAQLRVFPGDLHDVLNEHDRDAVHDAVAEFIGSVVAVQRTG